MTKYIIRQCTSDNYYEAVFCEFMRKGLRSFGGNKEPSPSTVAHELSQFKNTEYPTHHFYIVHKSSNEIVAGTSIIIRDSTLAEKKNLLVTFVNTDCNHRKQGLMNVLLNFVIDTYESTTLTLDAEDFEVEKSTIVDSQKFVKKYVPEGSFWTLYSAVGEYYARFGFSSCKTMNFYKINAKMLPNHSFELKENEKPLNVDNFNYYLTNDKYIPNKQDLSNESIRCSSFKFPTVSKFVNLLTYQENSAMDPSNTVGLVIHGEFGETILCIAPFFTPDKTYVRRIFSSVYDPKILEEHMERVYAFICWYVNPSRDPNVDRTVYCSVEDFVYNGDHKLITDFFEKKSWEWDDSNGVLNPMIREWKGAPFVGKWLYNGMWCMT